MLITSRRHQRGQALVLVALGMVAICGMVALAVDAGQLYFSRRLMQNAVDAGALAGAQELVGTDTQPAGNPPGSRYWALTETFKTLDLTETHLSGDPIYTASPVTDTIGGYTVTVISPTGYNAKRVRVLVTRQAPTTFGQVLGISSVTLASIATAEAGTNPKTYAIFAWQSGGSGNTIFDDQNGYGQVDDGNDGADACSPADFGLSATNSKFHVPNPTQAYLNVNGNVTVNSASDNHGLHEFWVQGVPFGSGIDLAPDYSGPNTSLVSPLNPATILILPGSSATIPNYTKFGGGSVTITNSSLQPYYVFAPGKYTHNLNIPEPSDLPNANYIFLNGVYLFSGANFTTTGGNIANTSDGLPHYSGPNGITDLPAASDGTNGVEFVFDGNSVYSASNTAAPLGGSVFFVSPSLVPTGSTHLAFYFPTTNTASGTLWSETFAATLSNSPRYQVWGTVFSAHLGSMTLTGVELGPHNSSPSNGLAGAAGQYAINGEFIGSDLQLLNGNVLGNTAGTAAACPSGSITPGTPSLMVQFNINFAPAPGVNSRLVD